MENGALGTGKGAYFMKTPRSLARVVKLSAAPALLLLWQALSALLDASVFPGPLQVLAALFHCRQSLGLHLLYSLWRLWAGLVCALIFGLPLGLLLGLSKTADACCSGFFYLVGPLPKAALLPLLLLLFGIGDLPKIVLVFLLVFFPLTLAVRDAVKEIPPALFDPYTAVGAGHWRILRDIALPACLPALFTALRSGLSAGISILFLAETYGTRYGMGFFIMDMWIRLDYSQMLGGILVMGVVGLFLNRGMDLLEKRLCPWSQIGRAHKESGVS